MADVASESSPTAEINEAVFCLAHYKEVCGDCGLDLREENDGYFGFDSINREGLEAPPTGQNKDNVYQCKKHNSTDCSRCYGWKKQITRARAAAKKSVRK